ncbi:hypothetical protein [Aurantiacibacter luteus]|nr:hypothetical protein [Aurantiacibacter luteus]
MLATLTAVHALVARFLQFIGLREGECVGCGEPCESHICTPCWEWSQI